MKRVKNLIKLTNLSSESLNEKEQRFVIGGEWGNCGCYYSACGGSSTIDNHNANGNTKKSEMPIDQAEWNWA